MKNKNFQKKLNSIINEVVSIQYDTSNWLNNINNPLNVDLDLSSKLLLSRCTNILTQIEELKNKTEDNTILTILLQNQIIIQNTQKCINDLHTFTQVAKNGIIVSNKAVEQAELMNFKQNLINNAKVHEED